MPCSGHAPAGGCTSADQPARSQTLSQLPVGSEPSWEGSIGESSGGRAPSLSVQQPSSSPAPEVAVLSGAGAEGRAGVTAGPGTSAELWTLLCQLQGMEGRSCRLRRRLRDSSYRWSSADSYVNAAWLARPATRRHKQVRHEFWRRLSVSLPERFSEPGGNRPRSRQITS